MFESVSLMLTLNSLQKLITCRRSFFQSNNLTYLLTYKLAWIFNVTWIQHIRLFSAQYLCKLYISKLLAIFKSQYISQKDQSNSQNADIVLIRTSKYSTCICPNRFIRIRLIRFKRIIDLIKWCPRFRYKITCYISQIVSLSTTMKSRSILIIPRLHS